MSNDTTTFNSDFAMNSSQTDDVTRPVNLQPVVRVPVPMNINRLQQAYDEILSVGSYISEEQLQFEKKLGIGGQGVVYRIERSGADGFRIPLAVKVFSPVRYDTEEDYAQAMKSMAAVSTSIATIQHDNLLNVNNWTRVNDIRIMEMEFIDGLDLSRIALPKTLRWLQSHCTPARMNEINRVVLAPGASRLRFQSGIAVSIIYDCLMGLGALHREGIVHADVKPSNIMIKRTGSAKIIDMGSAFHVNNALARKTCTPAYASFETLYEGQCTHRSDLASLGYVFLEMLTGRVLFPRESTLLTDKRDIVDSIPSILGSPLNGNVILVDFCRRLVSPDPNDRFESAESAATSENGAAGILRQLVKMNLTSEFQNDLRVCLEDLEGME